MDKLKSIGKKIANFDALGYLDGRKSLKKGDKEALAINRAAICESCDMNQIEPIDELKVKDSIMSISERYCDACGCSLPLLLRQNRKKCKLGKW